MESKLVTLTDIHKLEERYPFKEDELEILVRCHELIQDGENRDDFLMKLALSSPFSHFFLPGNEMRDRVEWIEQHILPADFAAQLQAAMQADRFVEYANQGEDKALECFIEGAADTGRRGPKEALRILYQVAGGDNATTVDLIDVCFRLALAADAIALPNLEKEVMLKQLDEHKPVVKLLADSVDSSCRGKALTVRTFTDWSEKYFPTLSTPLSTFVHKLLFHGRAFPTARIPFARPVLDHTSEIFDSSASPSLTVLSFASPHLGGKWHRLYSAQLDGLSFHSLEWSVLGYKGPTVIVIRTTEKAILGAFSTEAWHESGTFFGNNDCFLFQLEPMFSIHRALGREQNFIYLHSDFLKGPFDAFTDHRFKGKGMGFGGTKDEPRFFIPESLEHCSANFLDQTFEAGSLLPDEAMEGFEIKDIEIWGVGGDAKIAEALQGRAAFRERVDETIVRARTVHGKSFIAEDMKSGLYPNKTFSYQDQMRGRHEFKVDDEHGGYRIDHL